MLRKTNLWKRCSLQPLRRCPLYRPYCRRFVRPLQSYWPVLCGRLRAKTSETTTSCIPPQNRACPSYRLSPALIAGSTDRACRGGVAGVQRDNMCCSGTCRTCGGVGWGLRWGRADSCCMRRITVAGMLCSDSQAAPCIIDDGEGRTLPG